MATFVPALNLSSLKHVATHIGRAHTWELRNYATSVGRAVSSLATSSRDGVITEIPSQQQSKAVDEKGYGEEKNKVFWMRDPTTGDWIPEDHFGEIDMADLRAKLLPSRNKNIDLQ